MANKKAEGGRRKAGAKGSAKQQAAQIAVAQHPRAQRQINLAKSWAALIASGAVGYAAWQDGFTFVDVATRALVWGVAAYVMVWALGVQVWRHVAIAEVRAAERRWRDQQKAQADQAAKLRAAMEENGLPTDGTGVMPNA